MKAPSRNRRIASALAATISLAALATVSLAELIRPVEADFGQYQGANVLLVTDAGQPGVAGTGGVYTYDPNDPNQIIGQYAPTSGPGALKDPSAAEALGNGEVAIADTGNHRVLIVNQAGQITWNSANVAFSDGKLLRGPSDVQIIPDGTPSMADNPILIACKANNRVVKVKRTGQVMWAMNTGLSAPTKAEQLSNGEILIVDSGNNRVIQVNAAKQIVRSFAAPPGGNFTDAEQLNNGEILILDAGNGQLLRYLPSQPDPFIWDIPDWDLTGATDVDVASDGSLLFATPAGIVQSAWPDDWEMPW